MINEFCKNLLKSSFPNGEFRTPNILLAFGTANHYTPRLIHKIRCK